MSSKTVRRARSLSGRLTLWVGAFACVRALGVGAVNYGSMVPSEDRRADDWRAAGGTYRHEDRGELAKILVEWGDEPMRAIAPEGRAHLDTPVMARLFPHDNFPGPSAVGHDRVVEGRSYRLMAVQHDGWTYE